MTFALVAYNQEHYIREAVEGALGQTYEPLEIILSDDCSTDRTFEIMRETVAGYRGPHKVVLNRNEVNLGLTEHLNRVVLGLAHGELIVAAAGDDISLPHRTRTLLDAWATHLPCSAITSGYMRIDAEGRELGAVSSGQTLKITDQVELAARLKRDNLQHMFGCTLSFRRELFEFFGPLAVRYIEDGSIVARAGLRDGLVVIREVLVKYRTHAGSVTMAASTVEALQRFARMRQQTYLQTLVDISKLEGPSVAVGGRWAGLKTRIHWCLFRQDFVVWYLSAPGAAQVLLAPLSPVLCGRQGWREVLAVAFPRVYAGYCKVARWAIPRNGPEVQSK
ncbi:MAG: glycosyltransferase [Acidobacteria bacterium]|nr:glycosyltransferase [Acidobacteriota bacterium]